MNSGNHNSSRELIKQSILLSETEKNAFLETPSKMPDFLVQAASEAVKEEADFFKQLNYRFPEIYQYILDFNQWVKDDQKRFDTFPGFGFQFREDIFDFLYSEEPIDIYSKLSESDVSDEQDDKHEKDKKKETDNNSSYEFQSFGVEKLPDMSNFFNCYSRLKVDKHYFSKLLSESFSLDIHEKLKVIERFPTLSQFQIDELIRVFEEERVKFSQLAIENKEDIAKLQKRCLSDWKNICSTYHNKNIIKKMTQDDASRLMIDTILSIENAFHHLQFKKALKLINQSLEKHPQNIFLFEYYFQVLKIDDPLAITPDLITTFQNHSEFHEDFIDAIQMMIEFENIWKNGGKYFLKKIEKFEPSKGFVFIKSYLLSKYYLYFGSPEKDRFNHAMDSILDSISKCDSENIDTISCLFHHYINILIAQQHFSPLANILSSCDLPLYYQYIRHIAELNSFLTNNMRDQQKIEGICKKTLIQFIIDFAQINNQEDILTYFHGSEENTFLYETIKKIENTLKKLNLVNIDEHEFETKIKILINNKEYDKAIVLINEKLQNSEWGGKEYRLSSFLANIYFKQKKHKEKYKKFKANFELNKNFHHAYLLFGLLDNMEYKYSHFAKDIAQWITQHYYFLPQGHLFQFSINHYKDTKSKIPLNVEQHLFLAMASGFSKGTFRYISEYYRWISGHIYYYQMYDLLDGIISNGNFYHNIIGQQTKDWQDISIVFFLMSLKKIINDSESYNCLSLFTGNNKGLMSFIRCISLVQAQNVYQNFDNPVYFTNKSSDKIKKILPNYTYYFSLISTFIEPEQTWISYIYLLDTAKKLNKINIYLPAYFTSLDLKCEGLTDQHREEAFRIVSKWLDKQNFPDSFSFCIFIAKALISEKGRWIEEKQLPDTEGIAYDILRHAESLIKDINNINQLFLGDYAYENYLILISSEWYLLYRYPKESYRKRFERQIKNLKLLKEKYSLSQRKINIDDIIINFTSKEFIASIDSGRVVCNPQISKSKAWLELIDKIKLFNSVFQGLQEKISTAKINIDSIKKNTIEIHLELFRETIHVDSRDMLIDIQILFQIIVDQRDYKNELDQFSQKYLSGDQSSYVKDLINGLKEMYLQFELVISENQTIINSSNKEIQKERLKTCIELFNIIKRYHVMPGSDMFDSFRKRIRHGWLIASLKDCFTRHELIMDTESKDLSPKLTNFLNNITQPFIKDNIYSYFQQFKNSFFQIANKLDNEFLIIKNEEHPYGLLDYSDDVLKPENFCEKFLKKNSLNEKSLNVFFDQVCNYLNKQTLKCFDDIKNHLETEVYKPLEKELKSIERTITNEKKVIPDYIKLLAQLNDSLSEFRKGVERYKKWFAFYESSFRSFLLTEVIDASQQLVWDTHSSEVQSKKIKKATVTGMESLKNIYLKGNNFFELLDLFKILFQNVIFHSKVSQNDDNIDISIQAEENNKNNQSFIIHFSSTHASYIDAASLKNKIKDETDRNTLLCQQSGTGLATIEDILINHLSGISGSILDIHWQENEKQFRLSFSFNIEEKADKYIPGKEEIEKTTSVDSLIPVIKQSKGVNVLIVEDQNEKFRAIKSYLSDIMFQSNFFHAWDVQTALQLMFSNETHFDLVILDMTLPIESSIGAELKSLAGLSILKILNDHQLSIPCILMTQYTNWFTEAQLNNRIFIDNLNTYCKDNYSKFYKGAIRFSHTELAWQKKIEKIIFQVVDDKYLRFTQIKHSVNIKDLENQVIETPNNVNLLKELVQAYKSQNNFENALTRLHEIENLQPDDIHTLFDLSEIYSEIGDHENAMNYCNRVKSIEEDLGILLQEKILKIRKQWLNNKQNEIVLNTMLINLGELAKNLSHEFSTPLATFEITLHNLFRDYNKKLLTKPLVEEYSEALFKTIDHMKKLLSNIKKMAIDDTLTKKYLDINTVIEDTFLIFNKKFKQHRIDIHLDLNNIPNIKANKTRMTQVFSNLIMNSIDALRQVDNRKKEIFVETKHIIDTSKIILEFSDTGIGIPKNNRNKLFNLNFTSKLKEKGMGYGLWLVKNVISDLRGTIQLNDKSIDGMTTFHIEIPSNNE